MDGGGRMGGIAATGRWGKKSASKRGGRERKGGRRKRGEEARAKG